MRIEHCALGPVNMIGSKMGGVALVAVVLRYNK